MVTMTTAIEENLVGDRIVGRLTTAFAVLAMLLAAVGLYGVLSYSITRRTREIGLRIALGAERRNVRAMVLRHVSLMMGAGTLIGLALGVGLGRLSESLLFELKGYDPVVLATATVLLVLVVLGASAVPTYRATQIDPMRALRHE
jgi:ABC-type antimicrobial peptide transport system permease subunit